MLVLLGDAGAFREALDEQGKERRNLICISKKRRCIMAKVLFKGNGITSLGSVDREEDLKPRPGIKSILLRRMVGAIRKFRGERGD